MKYQQIIHIIAIIASAIVSALGASQGVIGPPEAAAIGAAVNTVVAVKTTGLV